MRRQLEKPLWSRPFDPAKEAAFQQFYADRTYAQSRFGVSLAFIAWCAFSTWDVLGFPLLSERLMAIRLLLVAPIIGWVWWVSAKCPRSFKALMQVYLFIGHAAVNGGLFLMMGIAWQGDPSLAFQRFWPAFAGVYFFQYTFLGMQSKPAALLGNVTLAGLCLVGVRSGTESHVLGAALLQLALLNLLGMIVCARNERHHRALFRFRDHNLRQFRTAQAERAKAQNARDEAICLGARAESATQLVQTERAKLAAAVEEKERFFSAAYHDLQQPLSVIGLYLRLAKSKLANASEPSIRYDLTVIEAAAQDIAMMFKGVRDTCEIGSSEPNLEPVDLNSVFDEIERELGERAVQKGLVLRVKRRTHPPFFALSDRTLLKRSLSNLVGNAIKYTERGGVVVGSVCCQSHMHIHVWDTGIGIPEEFQASIFEEYFRIENVGRDRKRGLGLGLAIVRRIEESLPRHRLSFRSKLGQGSRFSLDVPVAEEAAVDSMLPVAASASASAADMLEGKYVVVVEDERLILDGLVEAIRHAGCLVEGVETAAAARELFADRDRCPDVLVTDFSLRCGETALDVIAALRHRFEWATTDTPILFVTGELTAASVLADFEGRYQVYRKPIEPEALLKGLRDLVSPHPLRSRPSGHSPPEVRTESSVRQSVPPVPSG